MKAIIVHGLRDISLTGQDVVKFSGGFDRCLLDSGWVGEIDEVDRPACAPLRVAPQLWALGGILDPYLLDRVASLAGFRPVFVVVRPRAKVRDRLLAG